MDPKLLTLYLVTDEAVRCRHGLLKTVRLAVQGGVSLVQYRCKDGSGEEKRANAQALKHMLDGLGVPLIINDDLQLTLDVDAAGLHIGQKDMPVQEARERLGAGKILGLTVNNCQQLSEVDFSQVDYLGIGPVYPTISKKNPAPTLGVEGLAALVAASAVPVVAIGGIGPVEAKMIRTQSGAAGVAVVSAICAAEAPEAAARAFIA